MSKLNKIALLLSTALLGIEIYFHINSHQWANLFYLNGDSITLPILFKSLIEKEHFSWVFSSQIFIFPEIPIYALSYIFANNHAEALTVNAYINILFLLFIIKILINEIYWMKLYSTEVVSVTSLILILFFILEINPHINGKSVASLMLFGTYYFGVILVSLIQIVLAYFIINKKYKNDIWILNLSAFLGAICYASNPLYLLQFLAPFCIVVTLMTYRGHLERVKYFNIILFTLASLIIGFLIRIILSDYWKASVSDYISFSKFIDAWRETIKIISLIKSDNNYLFLWIFWLISWTCTGLEFFKICNKSVNADCKKNSDDFLLLGFLFFSPLITIAGVLATGNYLSRYYLPLPVYSAIGLSYLLIKKMYSVGSNKIILIICVFFIPIILFMNKKSDTTRPDLYSDLKCLERIKTLERVHLVGSFWTTRYLDLYRTSEFRSFQVLSNFSPFNWLNNRYNFNDYAIGGVIVDNAINAAHINVKDVDVLGVPSRISSCENFKVYIFDNGTSGYLELNRKLGRQ
jgi:hypothetical protein